MNDQRQRPSFSATTLSSFMRLQHKQRWHIILAACISQDLLSFTCTWFPSMQKVASPPLLVWWAQCLYPQDGEIQHCCSNLSSIKWLRLALWQGTHVLPPYGDTSWHRATWNNCWPNYLLLIVQAIKKPSKYGGDDLSLVPQYFQKYQIPNQGVWRIQCLFWKRSFAGIFLLLKLIYNGS